MLSLKQAAQVTSIQPNVEFSGDDMNKSVIVKLIAKDVPLAVVEDGLIGQLSLMYSKDETIRLADAEPEFRMTRAVENVKLVIGGETFSGLRVKKALVQLRARKLADITLTISGPIVAGLDKLHNCLRRTVDVVVEEALPGHELKEVA